MAEKTDQELRAMFASPDDWTGEALDSAKAELRNRGVDSPGGRPPLKPDRPDLALDCRPDAGEPNDVPDVYEHFGTYTNEDARRLLDAFCSGDIDYTFDMDKLGLADMSAFQAANGGTFGAGVGIAIGVNSKDCDRAMEIRQHVLKILP